MELVAFFGEKKVKDKYLKRVAAHEEADEIVKGKYWENGKGCAVGCTIHSNQHKAYETELGIPTWLARLEDQLFEGMENKYAKEFPRKFLEAIKPGANLDKIKAPFLIFVLESALEKFDHKKNPRQAKAVQDVIDLYKSGETDVEKFRAARRAYAAAADAAAADAADAAAYAADAAAADAADAADARRNEFKKFADKLLELMAACD